jgi:hypothetical protein
MSQAKGELISCDVHQAYPSAHVVSKKQHSFYASQVVDSTIKTSPHPYVKQKEGRHKGDSNTSLYVR